MNGTEVQNPPVTPKIPVQGPTKPNVFSKIKEKIPEPVKKAFLKFYSNKKVFWPVTIAFGVIFLVLIIGLLFGTAAPTRVQKTPKPTPVATGTPQPQQTSDILSQTVARLETLKAIISGLDLRQSRIKPPTINFDIRF